MPHQKEIDRGCQRGKIRVLIPRPERVLLLHEGKECFQLAGKTVHRCDLGGGNVCLQRLADERRMQKNMGRKLDDTHENPVVIDQKPMYGVFTDGDDISLTGIDDLSVNKKTAAAFHHLTDFIIIVPMKCVRVGETVLCVTTDLYIEFFFNDLHRKHLLLLFVYISILRKKDCVKISANNRVFLLQIYTYLLVLILLLCYNSTIPYLYKGESYENC